MLAITYCPECKDKILEYGEIVFTVFEAVCEQYYLEEYLTLSTHKNDIRLYNGIVQFLEHKGLVVTTESSQETFQVKPIGLYCFGKGLEKVCKFCIHEEITSKE